MFYQVQSRITCRLCYGERERSTSARRIVQSLFSDLKSEAGWSDSNSKSLDTSTSFGAARTVRVWHNCCSPALAFYCPCSVGLTGVGQFLAHMHHQIKHNSLAKQKCLQWQAPDIQNKKTFKTKNKKRWTHLEVKKYVNKLHNTVDVAVLTLTVIERASACLVLPPPPPHAIPPPPTPTPNDKHQTFKTKQKTKKDEHIYWFRGKN